MVEGKKNHLLVMWQGQNLENFLGWGREFVKGEQILFLTNLGQFAS